MSTAAASPGFISKLKDRKEVVEGAMAFRFERPSGWAFKAGQLGIRRKRNPLYVPLMIADESHVAKEAPRILPTGRRTGHGIRNPANRVISRIQAKSVTTAQPSKSRRKWRPILASSHAAPGVKPSNCGPS